LFFKERFVGTAAEQDCQAKSVSCVEMTKGAGQISSGTLLPHKCGAPSGYGTPHLCGSEEWCRAPNDE
jgi:hypothetical protein